MLSESVYGRTWHAARQAALGPELAATALARRHARNSALVLHDVYLHCIDSQQDHVSQRIEDALDADTSNWPSSQWMEASGYTYRRFFRPPAISP